MLGNRDFCFGAACLKDISTGGLAVEVDRQCRKGTVVIVQLGLGEPFDGPLLVQTEWSRELSANAGAPPTFLMGCSFTTPLKEKELQALLDAARKAAAAPAPATATPVKAPEVDPFVAGSASEKRRHVRRGGVIVPVTVCRADGGPFIDAAVVDRSLQGLGILSRVPLARGTWLKVRPRDGARSGAGGASAGPQLPPTRQTMAHRLPVSQYAARECAHALRMRRCKMNKGSAMVPALQRAATWWLELCQPDRSPVVTAASSGPETVGLRTRRNRRRSW